MAELNKAGLKRKLKEKQGLVPERHVLLCTGPNCEPEIAAKTWRCLGSEFKALENEGRYFHRTQINCFGLCRRGPIALVYPEGTYYHDVTPEVCQRIVKEHLVAGQPVEECAFVQITLAPNDSKTES